MTYRQGPWENEDVKNSCSTLPTTALALLLPDLLLDRLHHSLRGPKPQKHSAHMLRRYGEFASQFRKIWAKLMCLSNLRDGRAKMGCHSEEQYSIMESSVKQKIPDGNNAPLREQIGRAVQQLRARMNCTQRQFAELLGVAQSQIPKWEGNRLRPPDTVLITLAELAPIEERAWWRGLVGLRADEQPIEARTRLVPLLRDPAAAGTPRAMDEREIADYLQMPKQWLPVGGSLYAVEITGYSMDPILCPGFIVIVDVDQRSAAKLIGNMVLAREYDGLTVKWLRKSGTVLMLVPQNVNSEHPVQVIQPGADIQLIGAVVKWIGQPSTPKKRK